MTVRAREWYWHGGHLWPFETNDRAEFGYVAMSISLDLKLKHFYAECNPDLLAWKRQHLEEVRSVLHY